MRTDVSQHANATASKSKNILINRGLSSGEETKDSEMLCGIAPDGKRGTESAKLYLSKIEVVC